MKFDYLLSFICGIVLMAVANALSLGLLPCRTVAVVFFIVALAAIAAGAFLLGRRSCRNSVHRRSYTEGIRKGITIGRAERQSEVQRFLENE
ncbi:MAG: hypothetical protein J6A19_03240 [Oscillospiraceae bacterium]|nr:hypothetical protein [Oscillospiraceae bacterium]